MIAYSFRHKNGLTARANEKQTWKSPPADRRGFLLFQGERVE